MSTNNIVKQNAKRRKSSAECEADDDWLSFLQNEWDGHFQRYKELFITYCRKAPYHAKTSYRGGFVAKTKRRRDGKTYNPPLYDALADQLVTKHLDLHRYHHLYNEGLWRREEFWLGLRIGKRSRVKLIDLDNKHNIIGVYDGLFCDYPRPIVNYTLEDFKRLKTVYEQFPRHKWCISSATLGVHVWELLSSPQTAEDIERQNRPRLKAIGLGRCEVYPSPQLANQCVRRPFGRDYYTITDDGLVADWMEQLDYFESDQFPTFGAIVRAIIRRLLLEWDAFDQQSGTLVEANRKSPYVFHELVHTDRLRRDLLAAIRWKKDNFPDTGSSFPSSCLKSVIKDATKSHRPGSVQPLETVPWDLDLKDVNSGQWVESCLQWATSGLPGDDTLMPVVANLARWFYYVELVDIPADQRWQRVIELMQTFVRAKHNGFVSTLNLGKNDEVMKRIAAIVRRSIAKANEKDLFLRIVQKRRTGQYRSVYYLEPLITGRGRRPSSSSLCLKSVIKEIDDTPLPAEIRRRLEAIAQKNRMRRRKGEYPFVSFARRFLNALWHGEGKAHINCETINRFMDRKPQYNDFHQQLKYKRLLAANKLIHGDWERFIKRHERCALYRMTKETLNIFATETQRLKEAQ